MVKAKFIERLILGYKNNFSKFIFLIIVMSVKTTFFEN